VPSTVTINRPQHEVFDYLPAGTHNGEWRSGVLEIERTPARDGREPLTGRSWLGSGGPRIDGDYAVVCSSIGRRRARGFAAPSLCAVTS
jgi:hypothetical protein